MTSLYALSLSVYSQIDGFIQVPWRASITYPLSRQKLPRRTIQLRAQIHRLIPPFWLGGLQLTVSQGKIHGNVRLFLSHAFPLQAVISINATPACNNLRTVEKAVITQQSSNSKPLMEPESWTTTKQHITKNHFDSNSDVCISLPSDIHPSAFYIMQTVLIITLKQKKKH
jgi:hypothetical protein